MGISRRGVVAAALTAILMGGLGPAAAQQTAVVSGDESVVVDGDLVRIRSGSEEVTVSGDWRQAGTVYVADDTERVLVDLGAVVNDGRVQLDLAGDILFAFASAEIRADAAAKLAKVAHVIRARSVGEVHVIGHTDSIGSDAQNQRLSQERALSVMRWLSQKEGIPLAVMVGSGQGAKKPIAYNTMPDGSDSPDGRAKNRRVEIQMATREGVTIGPGTVTVTEDEIIAAGVKIDAGGVTVGGIRIDTREDEAGGAPRTAPSSASGTTCAALCAATAGAHPFKTIGCVEGAFEELGFDFDTDACDELEDAMAMGFGNSGGSLCLRCQEEQRFGDGQCATVAAQCFPQLK